jgi:P-type Cu+ transporter
MGDPVCGMTVEEAKAKATKCISEYQGKTYFFCTARCMKRFDEAPGKYSMTKWAMRPSS